LDAVQNALEDLQEAKEYNERTSDIRLKRLARKHFDKKRTYPDLDTELFIMEDLQQAKKYH